MNEKYKKIIKWATVAILGITAIILLIILIKPSGSHPPGEVNCCVNGQCFQTKKENCTSQGGVENCDNCASGADVQCGQTMLPCSTDTDCHKCKEFHSGVQMSCVQPQGSKGGKVCAPSNAKQVCNATLGGINVWSEWDNPDRMEWDCLCGDGSYAGGADADGNTVCNINPDICQGGTFTWNVDKKTNPDAGYCFCPKGTTLYTQISGGYPICIPPDAVTGMMYGDLYTKDGRDCPNLCGSRGTCGKDSKCVCDIGWGGGADCNGQSPIKDFGASMGALALTSNVSLGLHVTPGQPMTLDLPTPVSTVVSPFVTGSRTSAVSFHVGNHVYQMTIDTRTGHLRPSKSDESFVFSLSLSPTTGYLVGVKGNLFYFATGPGNLQTGSVVTMKERSTLTSADNLLSFTTVACTLITCVSTTPIGLLTPGVTWFNGVDRFVVDSCYKSLDCNVIRSISMVTATGDKHYFGILSMIGDKGVIYVFYRDTEIKTFTTANINTSPINWVLDTGDIQKWTILRPT